MAANNVHKSAHLSVERVWAFRSIAVFKLKPVEADQSLDSQDKLHRFQVRPGSNWPYERNALHMSIRRLRRQEPTPRGQGADRQSPASGCGRRLPPPLLGQRLPGLPSPWLSTRRARLSHPGGWWGRRCCCTAGFWPWLAPPGGFGSDVSFGQLGAQRT